MVTQPEIYLDDLTQEEKAQLLQAARKRMFTMGFMLIPPALLLTGGLIYVNLYKYDFNLDDDKLSYLNPITVIAIVLPIRFFVGSIISYRKESRSWQKRIIQGKIQGIKGSKVFVGRQSANIGRFVQDVKVGDTVEIGLSANSLHVIYVHKKASESEDATGSSQAEDSSQTS